MANPEHVEILMQGAEALDRWRRAQPEQRLDLTFVEWDGVELAELRLDGALLIGARLSKVNLRGADLMNADLSGATLEGVDLTDSCLVGANFTGVDLRSCNFDGVLVEDAIFRGCTLPEDGFSAGQRADLSGATFSGALHVGKDSRFVGAQFAGASIGSDLRGAVFRYANLAGADLSGCTLDDADFTHADLTGATLERAGLFGVTFLRTKVVGLKLAGAYFDSTAVVDTAIYDALGLETLKHEGPSVLDRGVIEQARGRLPVEFLRGCGLPDWEIESSKLHNPDLVPSELQDVLHQVSVLRLDKPLQTRPVFLSYSHADRECVEQLHDALQDAGVRVWRDVHDLIAGKLEDQIRQAISHRVVVVVLSERSVNSKWVEREVRRARDAGDKEDRDALCPIALDDAWKTCSWPEWLREEIAEYVVLDFSGWRDPTAFADAVGKLVRGIRKNY